jgi:hypothetical protein
LDRNFARDQTDHGLARALEQHLRHVDFPHHLEKLGSEMRLRARSGRADDELTRL